MINWPKVLKLMIVKSRNTLRKIVIIMVIGRKKVQLLQQQQEHTGEKF